MANDNKSKTLLDLPGEMLDRIGHFLMHEQADIHIESSGGSTPTFSYELCSEEAEESSTISMLSQKSGAKSLLKAYLYDITSFRLTCRQLAKAAEGVLAKQLTGCIFNQATFEKYNASLETGLGNAKSFLCIQLQLHSFQLSFLESLPSAYISNTSRLEVFLVQPDDPNRSADLDKLLPGLFSKGVNIRVDCRAITQVSDPEPFGEQSRLGNNIPVEEIALPTAWPHRQCQGLLKQFRTSNGGVILKKPGFDLAKARAKMSGLNSKRGRRAGMFSLSSCQDG